MISVTVLSTMDGMCVQQEPNRTATDAVSGICVPKRVYNRILLIIRKEDKYEGVAKLSKQMIGRYPHFRYKKIRRDSKCPFLPGGEVID